MNLHNHRKLPDDWTDGNLEEHRMWEHLDIVNGDVWDVINEAYRLFSELGYDDINEETVSGTIVSGLALAAESKGFNQVAQLFGLNPTHFNSFMLDHVTSEIPMTLEEVRIELHLYETAEKYGEYL